MSDVTVRLALVSHPDDVAALTDIARRVRGGRVTITAESIEAALCDDGDFDAAVVHSPADARRATEAGKHILLDAPISQSVKAAESLLNLVEQAGVVLAVGRLPRHSPANQAIIDRLSSGKLGEPGLLRVHRWSSEPEQSLAAKTFGHLELALHLFDANPTEVYAIAVGHQSYLQIHLGFPKGGMAILDFSERLPAGQDYDSLSVIGSQGAAYSDDHHNTHLLFGGANPTALISDCGSGQLHEIQSFVDCVARGTPPATVGKAILAVHRVIEVVGRSIDSGKVFHDREGFYEPV